MFFSNVNARLLSTCSLNTLFVFNLEFDVHPNWNCCFKNSYIHYHIISNMPKSQMVICTQQILQWNWFTISLFFWWIYFHIFLLCLNNFCIKRQHIFNVKRIIIFGNGTILKNLVMFYFILNYEHIICFW